jgi:hypothetical protein
MGRKADDLFNAEVKFADIVIKKYGNYW